MDIGLVAFIRHSAVDNGKIIEAAIYEVVVPPDHFSNLVNQNGPNSCFKECYIKLRTRIAKSPTQDSVS